MQVISYKLLIFCLFILLSTSIGSEIGSGSLYPSTVFAFTEDDGVSRIQKAYENIKDIKGDFIQKSHIKDLKRTDTFRGQFFIKPPKMKWDYKGDKLLTVYIAGEDMIIYQKKKQQALKTTFDRTTFGQAPIALLGGFGSIKEEFEVSQKAEDRLVLKPKKTMGNILYIKLYLSDGEFPIKSFTIIDTLLNKIEFQLKNVKINTGLKDEIFEFSPSEGVTVFQR